MLRTGRKPSTFEVLQVYTGTKFELRLLKASNNHYFITFADIPIIRIRKEVSTFEKANVGKYKATCLGDKLPHYLSSYFNSAAELFQAVYDFNYKKFNT